MKVLLSSAYLAPIQYYAWMLAADEVLLEQHDHYIKQTYRNRCTIAAADGPLSLTIPIIKPENEKCPMKDIRISDHGNWRHLHWNALKSAYRMSPFWEYYEDDFRPFYEQKWELLMDYNQALQEKVCELIDFTPNITRTEAFISLSEAGIQDLRDVIHPKREIAVDGKFQAIPYYQVFKERQGFLPNMSIMDLLMNMGPESILILKNSLLD
ncbi:MAG: WbqC family protein [Bacteroidaceae bacterium]|nr:WbqC family protein [Bacteroidaceae bacterium]